MGPPFLYSFEYPTGIQSRRNPVLMGPNGSWNYWGVDCFMKIYCNTAVHDGATFIMNAHPFIMNAHPSANILIDQQHVTHSAIQTAVASTDGAAPCFTLRAAARAGTKSSIGRGGAPSNSRLNTGITLEIGPTVASLSNKLYARELPRTGAPHPTGLGHESRAPRSRMDGDPVTPISKVRMYIPPMKV